ncbi:hypothetical protein KSP39_PZI006362 [Platanthera zijinensis]|uniref:Uncharacterized protein n=1 Tax=Platanthera zijinensis TaxID=2320716 RepID=A0AAP0BPZ9_9ASPA
MDRVFQEQKGRNLEMYVDDLMIKSRKVDSHIQDLEETFGTLQRYKMRLNLLKCVFGASKGKFLDHLLTPVGVEPNPNKVKEIMELRSPQNTKEAQTMTEFLADYVVEVAEAEPTRPILWKVMVDGASGKNSLGVRVILESPRGTRIEQMVVVHFSITNNQAEYEAVIAGLRLARELGVHDVEVLTDSMVVASQINGEFEAREPTLQLYLAKVKGVIGMFQTFSIRHVSREENEQDDQLAKHGPLPQSNGQRRFLLVMIDYFSKWLEVKALAKGISQVIRNFVWGEIICRHGLPWAIVTDNEPQFASAEFINFYGQLGIDLRFASVQHSRSNEQVEVANKIIINLLKKKVENLKDSWVEQLPSVLWAFITTPNTATGETPFKLSHEYEVRLPIEFEVRTPRVVEVEAGREEWKAKNKEELRLSLDMVEELREAIRQEEVK